MTTFNLNCFLTHNNNTAQGGGTWKYGTLTTGLPGDWVNGDTIATPTVLDITDYDDGATYPFVYTVGSPPCEASTTYVMTTSPRTVVSSIPTKNICVVNGALVANTVTVYVSSPANFTWGATSSNPDITFAVNSGSQGSGNFVLTILGPVNSAVTTTGVITITVTPTINPISVSLSCLDYGANTNPCGSSVSFTTNVYANISSGVTQTTTICSTTLTYNSFSTFFGGAPIVPSGYTETFTVDGVTVSSFPYTFNLSPSSQSIKRRVSNGTCTVETTSTVNISTGAASGSNTTLTICNT